MMPMPLEMACVASSWSSITTMLVTVAADRVALPQGNRQVLPLIAQVGFDGRRW